jgi:hypothetical protein
VRLLVILFFGEWLYLRMHSSFYSSHHFICVLLATLKQLEPVEATIEPPKRVEREHKRFSTKLTKEKIKKIASHTYYHKIALIAT